MTVGAKKKSALLKIFTFQTTDAGYVKSAAFFFPNCRSNTSPWEARHGGVLKLIPVTVHCDCVSKTYQMVINGVTCFCKGAVKPQIQQLCLSEDRFIADGSNISSREKREKRKIWYIFFPQMLHFCWQDL